MFRSFRVGSAFGIPVYLHSTLVLLPAWVLYDQRADSAMKLGFMLLVGVLFFCVLLHEFGHALMARRFGIRTRDITLYPIGGLARLESMGEGPGQEIAIALAGPAVNLVIAGLLLPLALLAALTMDRPDQVRPLFSFDYGPLGLLAHFMGALCAGNVFLFGFNLLPAFPMDGGRVLRAILCLGMSRLQATSIAVAVGMVVALIMVLGLASSYPIIFLIVPFVCIVGQLELRALRRLEAHEQARRLATAFPEPVLPYAELAEAPLKDGPAGYTGFAWDRERGAWVRWRNGRPLDIA